MLKSQVVHFVNHLSPLPQNITVDKIFSVTHIKFAPNGTFN